MEVALAQAETNLAYSYIRAPFAGYVAERNLDLGSYVSGATASTSTMSRGILSLHEIETVRILIEVVEKDVPLIQVGQKAEVRAEAYPDRVFEGTVTRVVQALNRATRTMTVEVDLPNKDHRPQRRHVRPRRSLGRHRIATRSRSPLDAVSRLEDVQYVYVVQDGKAASGAGGTRSPRRKSGGDHEGFGRRRTTDRLRERSRTAKAPRCRFNRCEQLRFGDLVIENS